jgi:L-lactate dehydrogenase complex protein LldE
MRVGLFVTCLADLMRPSIGFAALRLLESGGAEVIVPHGQTCCGQPGYNSGDREGAKVLAAKLIGEFEGCDYLVSPSGSCSGMIRTHYADLLRDDPALLTRASALAEKAYELTDFLASVLKLASVPGKFNGTVTYHDCCAGLREMGVKRQPRELLAKVAGAELREMADCEACCGFGGTFSIKFGEISARLADNKCRNIADSGADAVVLGDLGCILNIEGRLRRKGDVKTRVLHVAELLAGEDPVRRV